MNIKADIKGLKKVIKDFERFGDEGAKEFAKITKFQAQEIAADAKVNAPSNFGKLKQSIKDEKIDPLNYKIAVHEEYGAYVEFGTGAKVSVPKELQSLASQFRGGSKGTFEQGLRSIKDWCKTKGIPEDAAYPIFMSILKKGLRPQPYLYPAFVKGRALYLDDLKDSIKHLTKKFND